MLYSRARSERNQNSSSSSAAAGAGGAGGGGSGSGGGGGGTAAAGAGGGSAAAGGSGAGADGGTGRQSSGSAAGVGGSSGNGASVTGGSVGGSAGGVGAGSGASGGLSSAEREGFGRWRDRQYFGPRRWFQSGREDGWDKESGKCNVIVRGESERLNVFKERPLILSFHQMDFNSDRREPSLNKSFVYDVPRYKSVIYPNQDGHSLCF